jgi:hypothetical protein
MKELLKSVIRVLIVLSARGIEMTESLRILTKRKCPDCDNTKMVKSSSNMLPEISTCVVCGARFVVMEEPSDELKIMLESCYQDGLKYRAVLKDWRPLCFNSSKGYCAGQYDHNRKIRDSCINCDFKEKD